MKNIIALMAGTLFSVGLVVSGMTDASKVIGFLDIFGEWDASLMFVMGAALAIVIPSFLYILKMKKPMLCDDFSLPSSRLLDKRLVLGAVLFGVGWGLYGYCPGPAIASLTYLNPSSYVFVLAMLVGMYLADKAKGMSVK